MRDDKKVSKSTGKEVKKAEEIEIKTVRTLPKQPISYSSTTKYEKSVRKATERKRKKLPI